MSNLREMSLPNEVDTDGYNQNLPLIDANLSTNYLKPVSINNRTCKFVFESKGILSSDTKLVLNALNGNATNDGRTGYCQPNGVFALIEKAVMRFGSKTAITANNVGNRFACSHSSFTSGSTQRHLDHYVYGTNFSWTYKQVTANNASKRNGIGYTNPEDNEYSATANVFASATQLHSTSAQSSDFAIPLKVLFNGFLDIDLPLFYLDQSQELSIEIIFKQEATIGDRVIGVAANYVGAGIQSPIDTDNCLMITQTIYFSSTRMEQLRQAYESNGFSGVYNDEVAIKQSLGNAGVNVGVRDRINLGGAGRSVRGLLFANPQVDIASDKVQFVCGKYGSEGLTSKGFNVICNNKRLIPIDPELQNHENIANFMSSWYDFKMIEIPYSLYQRGQKNGISTQTLNSAANQGGIDNGYCYTGLKFEEDINGVSVVLDLYRKDANNLTTQDLCAWLSVRKIMNIDSNGMVSFAY